MQVAATVIPSIRDLFELYIDEIGKFWAIDLLLATLIKITAIIPRNEVRTISKAKTIKKVKFQNKTTNIFSR